MKYVISDKIWSDFLMSEESDGFDFYVGDDDDLLKVAGRFEFTLNGMEMFIDMLPTTRNLRARYIVVTSRADGESKLVRYYQPKFIVAGDVLRTVPATIDLGAT